MLTKITNGVKISVETFYQPEYSQPLNNEFMFAYRITISNESEYTVKLLRRNWVVFDSNGVVREVEGDGVVGQQPVIEPGESHQYVSGSHLRTEMGKMKGYYTMERLIDGKLFKVEIPEFPLLVPFKLN
jgi:ApaG protein